MDSSLKSLNSESQFSSSIKETVGNHESKVPFSNKIMQKPKHFM